MGYDAKSIRNESSVGLDNVLFRLQTMVNGTMAIESRPGEGTMVTITIPHMR